MLRREIKRASEIFETLRQRDSVQASLIMLENSRIDTALSEINAKLALLQQRTLSTSNHSTGNIGRDYRPV